MIPIFQTSQLYSNSFNAKKPKAIGFFLKGSTVFGTIVVDKHKKLKQQNRLKEGVISIDELSMPNRGCLNIWIDEIVPCLRDTETGEMKDTVVFRIESRS